MDKSEVNDTQPATTFPNQVAVATGEAFQFFVNALVLGLTTASNIRGTLSFSAILSALLADVLANLILLAVFIPGIPGKTKTLLIMAKTIVLSLRWISIQSMTLLAWILNQAVCKWQSFHINMILTKVRIMVACMWTSNLLVVVVYVPVSLLVIDPWYQSVIKECYFAIDIVSRILPLVVIIIYYVKIIIFARGLNSVSEMSRTPLQIKVAFSRAMMAITAFKVVGLLAVSIQSYITDDTNVIAIQAVKVLSSAATVVCIVTLCAPVRELVVNVYRRRCHSRNGPTHGSVGPVPSPPHPPPSRPVRCSSPAVVVIAVRPAGRPGEDGVCERCNLEEEGDVVENRASNPGPSPFVCGGNHQMTC